MKKIAQFLYNAIGETITRGICIALILALIFISGYISGMVTSPNYIDGDETAQVVAQQTTEATTQATTQTTTQTTTQATTQATTANTQDTGTTQGTSVATPSSTAPQTKAEIIAYFNECSDKVKTEATKVVRNFTDNQLIEDKLELPAALEGLFNTLSSSFLKKDETPYEMNTKELIIEDYPTQEQTWSSKATEADVAEATCVEEGDYYNITLKFNPQDNPVLGTPGIGSTFFVASFETIAEKVPGLQSMDATYYDCVVQAKIEKATGRVVWSNYATPILAKAQVNVIVKTVEAQIGMVIISDYSITY